MDQGLLVAEQELGQRLGQLGLAHPRGAQEDERAAGPLGVLEPGPGPAYGLGDGGDGVLLADDPAVQVILHSQQLLGLLLGELVDRDAGPQRQHLGDGLLVHLVEQVDARRLGLALQGLAPGQQLPLLVPQLPGILELLGLHRRLLAGGHAGQLGLQLLVLGRGAHALDPQPGAGLVDQVDGLVGQVAVRYVAVGQVGRGHQGLVGDGDPVVGLVALPQALEDLDGVGHGRLVHHHLLEPPLQRRVLLQVLAVLVEGGGADGLQLAPGQHGLEDGGRVDGALGRPGPDQGVDLVDEQDDVAPVPDLFEHLLEALLEVAPVAATGHQGAQVERVELAVLQGLGDVVGHYRLGQPLDDGGLAHSGLAHQHRVVLGAPAQDLHDPLRLPDPADDRVQRLVPGHAGEVAAELVEHQRARRRVAAGAPGGGPGLLAGPRPRRGAVAGQELDDLLADLGQLRAQLDQDLGGDALALPDEPEQDVLGADVVVAELERLPQAQLQHLLGPGGEGDVAAGRAAPLADDLLHLAADRLQADPQRLQRLGRHALALVDEAEQDVLGADVVVVEQARLLLRQHHHSASPVGEPLEHRSMPPGWDGPGRGRKRRGTAPV